MITTWLSNLLPKEDVFYRLLDDIVISGDRSTAALSAYVSAEDKTQVEHFSETIVQQKIQAKKSLYELVEGVCRSFITPFDREDMQELASELYSVPYLIHKIQSRLVLLSPPQEYRHDFAPLVAVVRQQSQGMVEVIKGLSTARNCEQLSIKTNSLKTLEEEGEEHVRLLLASMMAQPSFTSPADVFRKDVFDMLQNVTTIYPHCGNIALRIILKHS